MVKRKGRATRQPTVYLDTSIPSAYWYDGSNEDIIKRKLLTRDWCEAERPLFAVWSSAFAEAELLRGTYRRQDECLKMIRRLPYLSATGEVRQLAVELVNSKIVPETEKLDAYHLAIAVVHRMDYLLSWNQAHLVNEQTQRQVELVCAKRRLRAPLLVSPRSIPQSRFGDEIRREQT
jgi:hypothetical protein